MSDVAHPLRIAVILPCLNEQAVIGDVVAKFRAEVPEADLYVYDNGSSDATAEVASRAGAIVRAEPARGKGNAIRRAFADVEADVYVMADGDGTYDASKVTHMIELLISQRLDMVTGIRDSEGDEVNTYRSGHAIGNRVLSGLQRRMLGKVTSDVLSGYRVMTRRFVKSFAGGSTGFEIEMDLTSHAARLQVASADVATRYSPRVAGSTSKLRTYRDGWRILRSLLREFRISRPLAFFGSIAALFVVVATIASIPLLVQYFESGLVPRFPTAILSASMTTIAFVLLVCGIILDSVAVARREAARLAYLGWRT